MNAFFDHHHLLYLDKQWSAMTETRELRSHPKHKVLLHRMGHIALHREVGFVPVLPPQITKNTLQELTLYDISSPLKNIDNLQQSIADARMYPRSSELDKRIAELAIYALDLQKPFIKEYSVPENAIGHPQSPRCNYGKSNH